jgi:hypothetical protein
MGLSFAADVSPGPQNTDVVAFTECDQRLLELLFDGIALDPGLY